MNRTSSSSPQTCAFYCSLTINKNAGFTKASYLLLYNKLGSIFCVAEGPGLFGFCGQWEAYEITTFQGGPLTVTC